MNLTGLLPQNTAGLLGDIQEVGCFFRILGAMAEITNGKYLIIEQLNDLWTCALKSGIISRDRVMLQPERLVERASERLGKKISVWNCGHMVNGVALGWNGNYLATPVHFSSIHFKTKAATGHFCLGDKEGKFTWNPWNGPNDTSTIQDIQLYWIKEL